MKDWQRHLMKASTTLREAMLRIDDLKLANADVFVVDDNNHLLGSLSDGDIRRALINGAEMSHRIDCAMNTECTYAVGSQPNTDVVRYCKQKSIRFLPLVSDQKEIIQVIDIDFIKGIVPVEAIIMAGGEGKRLLPLTLKVPKPLLPIGGKPIIEHNIERLIKFGVNHIRISINYLGNMLQDHFGDGSDYNIRIDYVHEDQPMGTIGAVRKVTDWKSEHILVMNSVIVTALDFSDFYANFFDSGADLAIAATVYSVNVPYAVLETNKGNQVSALSEKPTYNYYSNAGIYLMKREVLSHIPDNTKYDMPDLIQALMDKGSKVVSYPIRGYWLDIGKMNDYEKAQEDIKHLNL